MRGLGSGGKAPPSSAALLPGGHRQQPLRHLYGGLRSGGVVGPAGQCTGATLPRPELGEPDGGGCGACGPQDACR